MEVPSLQAQLDPKSPWSMTNKDGGLSEKLYIAGQALFEAKSFTQPLSKDTIWQSIDAKYIREYLQTDCQK